jgi:hypothetical protein
VRDVQLEGPPGANRCGPIAGAIDERTVLAQLNAAPGLLQQDRGIILDGARDPPAAGAARPGGLHREHPAPVAHLDVVGDHVGGGHRDDLKALEIEAPTADVAELDVLPVVVGAVPRVDHELRDDELAGADRRATRHDRSVGVGVVTRRGRVGVIPRGVRVGVVTRRVVRVIPGGIVRVVRGWVIRVIRRGLVREVRVVRLRIILVHRAEPAITRRYPCGGGEEDQELGRSHSVSSCRSSI